MSAKSATLATAEQRSLAALVRTSPFRLFAIRLPDSAFLEVSDPLVEMTGQSREALLGMRLLDDVGDAEAVAKSLELVASGTIDGYTRHGDYRLPGGELLPVTVRVTALTDQCPRTSALVMVLESSPPGVDPTLQDVPDGVEGFVLGTVNSQWRIDRLTSDIGSLIQYDADALLGQSVFVSVHPEDVSQLLLLASAASARSSAATGRIRVRDSTDGWVLCRVAVLPLAGDEPGGFAFALSRADGLPALVSTRSRELEEHLRRIAREVTASGVAALSTTMPTALELPALGALTSREYEIVVRLVAGERVGLIARRLFLSESTVRNHLTSVYRKLGVASQSELLARLQSASGEGT